MLSTKSPAHKRPVFDRAVCGVAAIDIAAALWLSPKRIAAIQLPRTKRSFPKPRAASGWLPAAAFHPANPQAEASAKFLVPFSKKGTSFRDGTPRPRAPRPAALATRSRLSAPHAMQRPPRFIPSRILCFALWHGRCAPRLSTSCCPAPDTTPASFIKESPRTTAHAFRPRPQQTTVEARSPTTIQRPFPKRLSTPAASSVSFLKKYCGFDTMYLTPEWYCRRTAAGAPAPALPRQRSL